MELAGVKHRTDGPCFHCDTYGTDTDDPARLIAAGLVAFDLTRQYVGEDLVPAIEGWSWFDWCQRAEEWLARHG